MRYAPLMGLAALAFGFAAAPAAVPSASAGEVVLGGVGLGGTFRVPARTMHEAKFATVFRQQHDFSCGSAALASLLTYHYGIERGELDVFSSMYEHGDRARIERLGFSLLDMKQYLARLGIGSDGYRVPLERLATARLPTIALIDSDGYRHFVLVKGLDAKTVLVGDPARGLRRIPHDEFKAMWNGIAFVITDDIPIGQASFNRDPEWELLPPGAPLGKALPRTALATFTASLYRAGNTW
ncbi:bacteriocin resistance protein [Caenispirillum salinarum AK4]|uniref:Bacteriocin resistance protein n=1 Tax=Caenispirillum salinarum AK4 TaxID=1238182 RepID=K9H6Y0_9PROT|nr:C39 family peptidase [Caenispirillum salinarum]EKV32824.1 bacteriocin resistance protein [Caenispirillum salinarum AK4]